MHADHWAYHATDERRLPRIAKRGLIPRKQPACHADEKRCTDEAVIFFAATPEIASNWGEVVLRFHEPDEFEDDWYGDALLLPDGRVVHSNRYTHGRIPAHDIDVLTDDGWAPVTSLY
jgi:hypothetical protein